MDSDIQNDIDLVRILIETFIAHPAKLNINLHEHCGLIRWLISCDPADHGKLVGKQGAHFNALRCLIEELGSAKDEKYTLSRYLEPRIPVVGKIHPAHPAPDHTYSTAPAELLMTSFLEELLAGEFLIQVEDIQPHQYEIVIDPKDQRDYEFLTIASLTVGHASRPGTDITVIGALGTLYRAWGQRDGVSYSLEVCRPAKT